jgi:hypothetical protein
MRFLMKFPVPTPIDNPPVGLSDIEQKLSALLARIGALATYPSAVSGSHYYYVLVDVEPERMTEIARPIFQLLGVRPEFLPEIVPESYYGLRGY